MTTIAAEQNFTKKLGSNDLDQINEDLVVPTLTPLHKNDIKWGFSTGEYLDGQRTSTARVLPTDVAWSDKSAATDQSFLNGKLYSAWLEKTSQMLADWNDETVKNLIRLCERYWLTLRDSPHHRITIATMINILRFRDITDEDAPKLARVFISVDRYGYGRRETVKFIRDLRQAGFSPSALGE